MKFNETCCAHGGVPEECMGLCREKDQVSMMRRSIDVMPVDRCVKHRDNIESCVYKFGKKCEKNKNVMSLKSKF